MSDSIRVFAISPSLTDGTSFWRGVGSLMNLRAKGIKVDFCDRPLDWPYMLESDIIYLQRPYLTQHRSLFDKFKFMQKRLWLDYDDLLTNVPPFNPSFATYANGEFRRSILYMLANADVVTVSTRSLADALNEEVERKYIVIPNALNDYNLPPCASPKGVNKVIFWRGSATHAEDLDGHADQIIDLYENSKYDDFKWVFFGGCPYNITKHMTDGRVIIVPTQDCFEYMKQLRAVVPGVLIYPLVDHQFNRTKSNIAWIEATWAGALTVAPAFKEWELPGVENYDAHTTIRQAVDKLLDDAQGNYAASKKHLQTHFRLSQVNELRVQLIRKLMEN